MSFFRSVFTAAISLATGVLPITRAATSDADGWNEISLRTLIADEMKTQRLNAAIVGVWIDGNERFLEAFGSSMTGVPASPEMRFRAGGVTLTSLCIMLLQFTEEGVFTLDDPISKWRPDLPNSGKVTLRMLANCTAGYPDYVPVEAFVQAVEADVFREWTDDELVSIALEQPFPYEPGKGWNYSHTNFVILGGILEQIAKKPLSELFQERILSPLGLKQSFYGLTPAIDPPVLHAFTGERGVYEDSTFWNPAWTGPSGRMVSTVPEVARIAMALAGPGLLSEKSRGEMVAPDTVGIGAITAEKYYGLGVGVMSGWIVQNPNMNGFHTFMATLPDNEVTIVVTSTVADGYDGGPAPSTDLFRKIAALVAPNHPVETSF